MKSIVMILLTLPLQMFSQRICNDSSVYKIDLKANHLVREQFFSLSLIYPIFNSLFLEAKYGYLNYHQTGLSIGYQLNLGNHKPYLVAGAFYNKENFTKNTYYKEYCLKFGVGLDTELSNNFYLNIETTVLNYLSIKYSLRKIKYKEFYDFGESLDYSVSMGIGYHFSF